MPRYVIVLFIHCHSKLTIIYYVLCFQLRNVFGGAHHAPHALFVRVSKMHNNGRLVLFIKPSECRMGGAALQLLRVMRLKDTLAECMTSKLFLEMRKFHFLSDVAKSDEFWELLFAVCQCLYPLYRLLRLCDMKIGGICKVKYYVMQVDKLLDDGINRVVAHVQKMESGLVKLENAARRSTKNRAKGGLKTEGLEDDFGSGKIVVV